MAFLTECECMECGEIKREDANSFNGKCSSCRAREASKAKRKHLASLKGLTVEERLERIEELLYDLNADKRISALEAIHATYS